MVMQVDFKSLGTTGNVSSTTNEQTLKASTKEFGEYMNEGSKNSYMKDNSTNKNIKTMFNKSKDISKDASSKINIDKADFVAVEKAVCELATSVVNSIKDILDCSANVINESLEKIDAEVGDLLDNSKVKELIMHMNNIEDASELIVNQEVYEKYNLITNQIKEIFDEFSAVSGLTEDEAIEYLNQIEINSIEINSIEKESISIGNVYLSEDNIVSEEDFALAEGARDDINEVIGVKDDKQVENISDSYIELGNSEIDVKESSTKYNELDNNNLHNDNISNAGVDFEKANVIESDSASKVDNDKIGYISDEVLSDKIASDEIISDKISSDKIISDNKTENLESVIDSDKVELISENDEHTDIVGNQSGLYSISDADTVMNYEIVDNAEQAVVNEEKDYFDKKDVAILNETFEKNDIQKEYSNDIQLKESTNNDVISNIDESMQSENEELFADDNSNSESKENFSQGTNTFVHTNISNESHTKNDTNKTNLNGFVNIANNITEHLNNAVSLSGMEQSERSSLASRIVNQILDNVRVMSITNATSIEMQLEPENLGKLNIQIVSKDGVITAQITAQNEAVRQAIESQISVLKENLNTQEIRIEDVEVTVASHAFEENMGNNSSSQDDRQKKKKFVLDDDTVSGSNDLKSIKEELLEEAIKEQQGSTVSYTA